MLENLNLERILFLDIETVPYCENYNDLNETFRELWDLKAERIKQNDDETPESLYERAGIYAEFGKIVCISTGFFYENSFRIKSFASKDEKTLLNDFANLLVKLNKPKQTLCAHNGKEFDFPYICRRMIVNSVKIPKLINMAGRKPWETSFLDTMELWKFGDYKSYTSLALLSALLGIPTPKDDINGADVAKVFWKENDLERIVKYCQKDTLTVAQLLLKFQGLPLLTDEQIVFV
jgi:uncharacterized protein YprB with RNaseH-like and TPR domain